MPNCFSLTRKTALDQGPVSLSKVDEEICAHLGVPVHPTMYCYWWYDLIGFGVATGKTFDDFINDDGRTDHVREIARFLKDNFVPNAWAER